MKRIILFVTCLFLILYGHSQVTKMMSFDTIEKGRIKVVSPSGTYYKYSERVQIKTDSSKSEVLKINNIVQEEVIKTINLTAPGTLSTALTPTELSTITNLTITGSIDTRDFVVMRDKMPLLDILDISAVTIQGYNGNDGTAGYYSDQYKPNEIPLCSFSVMNSGVGKITLKSVNLPNSSTSIGENAFNQCSGLTSITIPNSVTSIGNFAFNVCSGLTSVMIPNSVTSIGGCAFQSCSNMTSLTFGNSVASIGSSAFFGCSGLTSVSIPNSVTTIEAFTFYGCSGLTSLTIGNSVTSIGYCAFQYCTNMTSLTFGNSVTSIGFQAFVGCYALTSITIPNSVTSIGNAAFASCVSLTEFVVQMDNPNYAVIEGVLFNKDKTTLIQYPAGKQGAYIIPNSVVSIGISAFGGCYALTSITIPNSVVSIGISAFGGCYALTSITIPNSVSKIEDWTFSGCSGMTSIIIPNSIDSIGVYAFAWCSGLTSLTIPNSVTTIESNAFYACTGLTNLTIGDHVISIGSEAFGWCSGLTKITIPNSVNSMGEAPFDGCIGLTEFIVETSNANYSVVNGVLFNKNQTTLVAYPGGKAGAYNIPNSVTSIGLGAFINCKKITNITIDTNANLIGIGAFSWCTELVSITIPNSVTSIGNGAFCGCTGLTYIYSYADTPVDLSSINDVFTNVNKATCILYVPLGSKNAYQAAAQWKDFTKMVEMATALYPPVANAGPDQSVNEGATVTLDGSASTAADNDPLTYKWTAPGGITLNSTTTSKPTFTVPRLAKDTTYTFNLVVNDGTVDSPADQVKITVNYSSQQDSLALVALFKATDGPNWTRKNNWLTGPIDSWEGVTIENGRVVGLGLGGAGLNGAFPAELSDLTSIRTLDLMFNKLSGLLPESWSALVNLQKLDLRFNQLSGNLPESWSALVNLQSLYLHFNQLSGNLPGSWSALLKLQDLRLYRNQLTGVLPDSWSSLVNLTVLYINENQITGIFPESWRALVNLLTLGISNNNISDLPNLSPLINLVSLSVQNNMFDFGDIESNIGVPKGYFSYSPQAPVGIADTIIKKQNEEFRISVTVGGKSNQYQWYKNGVSISGAAGTEYVITSVSSDDAGDYTCQITNTVTTQLTLQSQPITLQIQNLVDEKVVQSSDLKVYSISSKGIYKIDGLPTNTKNEIAVYTLDGKLIKKINSKIKIEVIDISNQASGSYLLIINKKLFKIEKSN